MQAGDEAAADRIAAGEEDDWYSRGRRFGRQRRCIATDCNDDGYLPLDEISASVTCERLLSRPITGSATCCPRGDSGHAVAAAPPSSARKSRRFRSTMGSPSEPAVPAYRSLRLSRKHGQVLGADLNSSEILACV